MALPPHQYGPNLKRKFEAAHRVAGKDPAAPKKEANKDVLARENEELRAEIKRMKADGGSGRITSFDDAEYNTILHVHLPARTGRQHPHSVSKLI
jgi:hypothetical protein